MKSGTKTNNVGKGYNEIIHLLDSSDTEDDGTTTKVTTTKFRVLEDNCLLILDSDDEDNIIFMARPNINAPFIPISARLTTNYGVLTAQYIKTF